MTDAAKREVAEMVNAAVNGAVTNHLSRFRKTFSEEIQGTLTSTLSPLSEQLKQMSELQATRQEKPKAGELPVEVSNSLKRYEDRIRELEGIAKNEREAREQEKATRLRDEERGTLANALRAAGLADPMVRAAVSLLHTEDKRVARTDEGKIVFRFPRGSGNAQYVDELDLDKGVSEWLKSDEGKNYVPARPAQGAGGQPARAGGPKNRNEAREQATADLAKILLGGGTP